MRGLLLLPGMGPRHLSSLLAATEEGEHAATFLGLPIWIWQIANLALFLGLLYYFVARPMVAVFRKRQLDVEARLREAQERRAQAAALEADIHARLQRLDSELAEIQARGVSEGETERRALYERSIGESEKIRAEAAQEIERRLESAKHELARAAAALTASSAREILSAELTEQDRQRLLEESVARLGGGR